MALTRPPGPGASVERVQDPMKPKSSLPTAAKVVLGIAGFFGLLLVGFVFFIAVVCGV